MKKIANMHDSFRSILNKRYVYYFQSDQTLCHGQASSQMRIKFYVTAKLVCKCGYKILVEKF